MVYVLYRYLLYFYVVIVIQLVIILLFFVVKFYVFLCSYTDDFFFILNFFYKVYILSDYNVGFFFISTFMYDVYDTFFFHCLSTFFFDTFIFSIFHWFSFFFYFDFILWFDFVDFISFYRFALPDLNVFNVFFNTKIVLDLNCISFIPMQRFVTITAGEPVIVFFKLINHSDSSFKLISIFDIIPSHVYPYLKKIQCFCFDEILLKQHEVLVLPLFFVLDPLILNDLQIDFSTIDINYALVKST